jgi:HAD superfamily hydrolase (TIGR01509 family)
MRLQALIFDVDGTLAETEELHRRAFNDAFRAAGLAWHWTADLYAQLLSVTGGKERILHFTQVSPGAGLLDKEQIAALHGDKNRRYAAALADGALPLRPGVRRILDEARRSGLRLAIATTTSRENVDALLAASQGAPTFEIIAAGDQVAAKKPAPDVYALAVRKLGLVPAQCLALEDSVNGLRSALAAEIACVVTRSVYGGSGPFSGAISVVTSLGDPGAEAECLAGLPLEGPLVDVPQLVRWHKSAVELTRFSPPQPDSPPRDHR